MADRYAFQSPFSRGSGSDPWFMAGSVAVTTTVAVTALGLFGILLFVLEGGIGLIGGALQLETSAITGGQLWRFATYLIPPDNNFFWALLGLVFFFMIGSQFETMLGRRAFTGLVVSVTVIPAVIGVVLAVLTGLPLFNLGISILFLGVAAGFSAAMPQARSFFGIPFWVVVAFIFVVQVLSFAAQRSLPTLVMVLAAGAISLIVTRSLGFSNVEWIPALNLPGFMTNEGVSTPSRAKKPKKKKKKRGRGNLSAVPSPASSLASEAEIDALLDQLNEHGIDSLTKAQRQTLERHAKEMRKRRDG